MVFLFMAGTILMVPGIGVCGDDIKPDIVRALDLGDTTKALSLLRAEIKIDGAYHANYFTIGMIFYKNHEYAEALDQFELAVDRKGKHYPSLYHLGLCQLNVGDLDAAEETFKKGIKKAKKLQKGWFENGRGLVMMAREEYEEADRAFRSALVIDPDDSEYHLNLGDANFYQGIPALAVGEYEQALEADTASTEVYYHWAEACLEMKDYACAIEKLQIVLQKDSTYADAWMRAGGIYFRAALSTRTRDERKLRFMDAIGSYKRYLELANVQPDSAHVRIYFELAMSYVSIGGAEDAVQYFDDVLSIPYEARDIYYHYGEALWGVQDFVKSGEMLHKHILWVEENGAEVKTKVDDDDLYQYLGDSYFYRSDKDYRLAAKYYQMSIDLNPNQKRIMYNLAVAYHQQKELGKALEYYQKRIDIGIDSTKTSIIKNAAYCALSIANSGMEEEDEDILEEDEDILEEEDDIDTGDGGIDPDLNYYQVAADYLDQYLVYSPDDAKALALIANTYLYQLAECANGVKYYQQLLTLEPNNCDAKKSLGYAYFGGLCTKNYTKALGYLVDANSCITAEKGACEAVDITLYVAQCYHLRATTKTSGAGDDYRKANEWYKKVLKCDPSNADAKKGRDDTSYEF
jgi:tetratricopeptide (TPR) repeat protein